MTCMRLGDPGSPSTSVIEHLGAQVLDDRKSSGMPSGGLLRHGVIAHGWIGVLDDAEQSSTLR